MNFFRRRPLALIIALFLTMSTVSALLPASVKLVLICVCIIAVPILILLTRKFEIKQICNISSAAFISTASAFMICSILLSYAYYDAYAGKYASLKSETVRANVTSVEYSTSYSALYSVKLESLSGEASGANGLVYSETAISLSPGDTFEATLEFVPFEEFYGNYTFPKLNYLSDGYVFTANMTGSVKTVGEMKSIGVRLSELRKSFSAKMSLYLDDDAASLADALFLGERNGLDKIYRDFNRIGIVHLLALSGLHLAILDRMISKILEKLGVRPRQRDIFVLIFIVFYTALTGFLMSVMRAAIMLIIARLAMFVSHDADRITTLFVACGLIVLVSPGAVFDVSLQLSFFSTLGILVMAEATGARFRKRPYDETKQRSIGFRIMRICESALLSLAAVMFILPLQWLYFGEVSLLSVPATLIMSVFCEGLLVLIPIYLVFSLVGGHFICGGLAWAIEILTKICTSLSGWLASFLAPISLKYPFALPIILICLAVIIIMMIKNVPNWFYALIPFGIASVIFLTCTAVYENIHMSDVTLDYINDTSGDVLIAVAERNAMVIDISEGSSGIYYDCIQNLGRNKITEIDTVLYTHIHRRHVNSLRKILNKRVIKRILLPMPTTEYDKYITLEICTIAEKYGTEAVLYSNSGESSFTFGSLSVTLPEAAKLKRSTHPLMTLLIEHGDTDVAYIGKSAWEDEAVIRDVKDAEHMIFGTCGPKIKAVPSDDFAKNAKVICIPTDTLLSELSPWIDTFGGTLIGEDRLKIVLSD
ncbi:MAG: ComEC/Rec2 family competence protein [Clostridia bacterium]|nr:ComEC/Rec2 family competence protein [Clostridia bacterium]